MGTHLNFFNLQKKRTSQSRFVSFIGVLLVFFFAYPCFSNVHPRLLDWQARLDRLLPESVQTKSTQIAKNLPLTATIPEIQFEIRNLNLRVPHEPVELFVGIKVLLRKDIFLSSCGEELETYNRAIKILDDYCYRVNKVKKVVGRSIVNESVDTISSTTPSIPSIPSTSLPKTEENLQYVNVLRVLPEPNCGMSLSLLKFYQNAAESDKAELNARKNELLHVKSTLFDSTKELRRHLNNLAQSLNPLTGLPNPRSLKNYDNADTAVERIPPQPPFDLKEIKESED